MCPSPVPQGRQHRVLLRSPGAAAEGDAAGDGAALHKQLGEGGVGQVILPRTARVPDNTEALLLQHALSVPVQLRPAQLPAAQPGQGEAGAGGQAAR